MKAPESYQLQQLCVMNSFLDMKSYTGSRGVVSTPVFLFLCGTALGSVINVGILESHPANITHVKEKLDKISNIELQTIIVPLDQPFVLLQKDITDIINRLDVLIAPEEACSTLQMQLSHFGHEKKKVTCFTSDTFERDRIFFPPALLYSQSIIKTIIQLKWSAVIILGPNSKEVWSISEELTANGILCLTFQYNIWDSADEIHDLINSTITTDDGFPWNYLLLGPEGSVQAVLNGAEEFDVRNLRRSDMRSTSEWLVVVQERNLELFHYDMWLDNIAVLVYPDVPADWPSMVTGDCWGSIYTLMYRKVEDGHVSRRLQHVGNFDCNGYVRNYTLIFPNIDYGFNGRLFIASTVRWEPFTFTHNTSEGMKFEGLCVDMLHQLSVDLNFTYIVKLPKDGEWGQELSPMKWSGMVGELQNNEIDMTVAALTISSSRLKVMDFTYPFGYDKGVGVYRVPESDDTQWKTLFFPFTWEVHMGIAISFMFSVFFLYLLQWIHRQRAREELDLGDTSLLIWGMFIRYSHEVKSVSMSTSCFISAVWFFGTIATAVYCGNLMAFFAVTKETLPFRTIPEVAAQDTYKWGTQGGTFWVNIFEHGEGEDYQAIWRGIQKFNKTDPDILHRSEFLHRDKVEAGNYVFFVEADMLKGWARENCKLRLLEDSVYQVQYGIGLSLHSPYTKLFSTRLVAFSEEGLFVAWKKKWWRGEDACSTDEHIKSRILSLSDLQSAFYVLGIGIAVGVWTIVCEKLVMVWRQKYRPAIK